jgi:hypothetical protein
MSTKAAKPNTKVLRCQLNTDLNPGFDSVLCRIKDLGTNAKSMRLPVDLIAEADKQYAMKYTDFLLEVEGVVDTGKYLKPVNAKIISSLQPPSIEVEVDLDEAIASAHIVDAPF